MARSASFRSMEGEKPKYRRLRVFAFDPGFGARLETLSISELTLEVLWEDLEPGPVGEYIEVIDYDPASDAFYAPVDLNQPYLLAQAGLAPTSNSPQFHQQMVYAVAMNTINHFERALGRVALWNHRLVRNKSGSVIREEYVPRLRIYPHALREANAFYSPRKRALLFGYFPARGGGPGQAPGGTVFTSLSYDVVAHETTHALLDGLHPSFNEPTNPDMYALHEGFADIVALFQRFAHPKVLENEIARTRGHLELQNALGELAQQLGQALGMRGALRDALGGYDASTGAWRPHAPDPTTLKKLQEPHQRGAILVAAVFSAFLAIYKLRSADLLRIATNGTGVLPPGEIQPDLVRRLAQEAAAAADALLTMCIRGFDYCPPLDIDLGNYLRAVVTGDMEVYPQEKYNYRIAFIEAFRQWGIYPEGVRSMAENDLRYSQMGDEFGTNGSAEREDLKSVMRSLELEWDLAANRERVWQTSQKNAAIIHRWLTRGPMRNHLPLLGLTLDPHAPPSVYRSPDGTPTVEVHSVRVARRRGFRDTPVTDLVVEVRQRRRGYFDPAVQEKIDQGNGKIDTTIREDFRFRRGCTLIIDPVRQQVRYAISTRKNVADNQELDRVRRFLKREAEEIENPFYRPSSTSDFGGEPFAALHRRTGATPDF